MTGVHIGADRSTVATTVATWNATQHAGVRELSLMSGDKYIFCLGIRLCPPEIVFG